ncbi:hypothetical protein HUW51_08440 [Adhaeribacter swui]|uniref:Reverse transcriptase domain-containing protein n=1 Tax=Adhaeribacter swui TaxID=2086471 RepID=A0A7G7G6H4_9BACT|nr:RNA-directed DNA polymerase [Adhaeribacter swui]QNF32758.1 hypothetical protein HUW51_08440 [Adhaeribacter swui]
MKDLDKAFAIENLSRSWRWLNSSAKLDYKNYFRHHYNAYAVSSKENLESLRKRLKQNIYTPSPPVKIYLPKKSGILRPFTILTIEDQIVYQSFVNVIAEKLYSVAGKNYDLLNFGNQYAGSKSRFFLKDWKKGYKGFNSSIETAFNAGFTTTATFDLTAFYDSIDHKVLRQLLQRLGISNDFNDRLISCLEKWTCHNHYSCKDQKNEVIYHGHGIPQGPMASGILAEVVMTHIDEGFKKLKPTIKYLRYVDDIRLMALDEYGIRSSLLKLDLLSKEIGLFPQSSKINIHKIIDLAQELKSISLDPEIKDTDKLIEPDDALEKIDIIIRRDKNVNNETALKFIIGLAIPSIKLDNRLIKLLDSHSHLYKTILRYFERRTKLSKLISKKLVEKLKTDNIYEEVTAKYLVCLSSNIHEKHINEVIDYCLNKFKNIEDVTSPNLQAAIISWILKGFHFRFYDLQIFLKDSSEWVIQSIMHLISEKDYGLPSYELLINSFLERRDNDTALNAAYLCIVKNLNIQANNAEINDLAQIALFNLGKLKDRPFRKSTIPESLKYLFGDVFNNLDWNKFLGKHKLKAETQIYICKMYSQTDATAFVNQLDVFNDLLLDSLYLRDNTIGKYNLGKIGSIKNSVKLKAAYPNFALAINLIHELRLKSELSHSYTSANGKRTKRISFTELSRIRKKLIAGYSEYIDKASSILLVSLAIKGEQSKSHGASVLARV